MEGTNEDLHREVFAVLKKWKGSKAEELLKDLKELGIPNTMLGVLRARQLGLLTPSEQVACQQWLYASGVPQDWYKTFVWQPKRRKGC